MICCALFEPFAIWHSYRLEPKLANTPLITVQGGRVAELSVLAKQAGIETGMSIQGAKSLCPDVQIIATSPETLEQAWQQILEQLYAFSNRIESYRPGLVFLDLKTHEIKQLKEYFSCKIAAADNRQDAHLLALIDSGINNKNISNPQKLIDNIPLASLQSLGLQKQNIERLKWLGVRHFGQLKKWSKSQLQLFLQEDSKLLINYLYNKDSSNIRLFKPKETVKESFYFEDAVFEPYRLEPVLQLLADKVVSKLEGRAAKRLNLTLKAMGMAFTVSKISKLDLREKEVIFRLTKQALEDSGAQGLGIDEIRLELTAIYRPGRQLSLWRTKENRENAIQAVERRFPNSMLHFELLNPFTPISEFAYGLVAFSGERMLNEQIKFSSRNGRKQTKDRKRPGSLANHR